MYLFLNLGNRGQRVQDGLGIINRRLDNSNQALESRVRRIPKALIHPALARRNTHPLLSPQAIQRHHNLLSIAAAHAVRNDVHVVARVAQVQRRLGDANVRLDADQGNGRLGLQLGFELGDEHGELGLVDGVRGEVGCDAGDGLAEFGGGLGCCVDGDGGVFGKG